jgi:hypothetical protein
MAEEPNFTMPEREQRERQRKERERLERRPIPAPSFWTDQKPQPLFVQQLFALSIVVGVVAIVAIVSWFLGK